MNDDLLDDFLLEAHPNPERKGCPDDETLRALAEDRLPPGQPVLQHLASCSECYAEYRNYRQDWKELGGKDASRAVSPIPGRHWLARAKPLYWAIAAVLLLCIGGGVVVYRDHQQANSAPQPTMATNRPVDAKVDLFSSGTFRGTGDDDTMPLSEVSLPSATVNLSVVLPRFSESGSYKVVVSRDKVGQQVIAEGAGQGIDEAGRITVRVSLDLRSARSGTYFLATVRGTDNGTYYYPLKIK